MLKIRKGSLVKLLYSSRIYNVCVCNKQEDFNSIVIITNSFPWEINLKWFEVVRY